MDRGQQYHAGGIASLSAILVDHGRALNYDLLTRLGVSVYDIPGRGVSWDDVRDFVMYLDASSALVSEMNPEVAGWQGDQKTPMLLAQIADTLAGLQYAYTICHTKKGAKKPKAPDPIPRPGVQSHEDRKTQHWGQGSIPMSAFSSWWNSNDEE